MCTVLGSSCLFYYRLIVVEVCMCLVGDLSWIGVLYPLCSAMNPIHCITLVFPYGPVHSPMDLYVPLWTCMFPYGPVRSPMDLYVPLWTCMFPYGPVCSPMDLYVPLWTCMFPYGPVRSPMDLYVPLWTCMFPCPHHIRVSYVPLQLALKYHPDKNPGAEEQVNTYMHIPLCVIAPSLGVKHYFYYHSHTYK